MEELEDDIFDRNIDQLDVRETPRWELSEEEPSGDSDVETLVNQQKKDFSASERETRTGKKMVKAPLGDTMATKIVTSSADVINKLPAWEGDDDADSLKDYTSNDRKNEEKYMERTDEAIYQRASEEHIKRPPLWHDNELDSLRDFGRISGKQEIPSGTTSQQISRLPSDEELCLSPPWNDEDDGQVRNLACAETEHKSFTLSKMVVEQRIKQTPRWHDDDTDSTRDYSQFWKMRSMENSRRPSDENIHLTPPWMEDDRDSCGVSTNCSQSAVTPLLTLSKAAQHQGGVRQQSSEVPRIVNKQDERLLSCQSSEVPRIVNKQDERLLSCTPKIGSNDTRMYGVGCSANKGIARSVSQSSLEANCYSPHDALEGLETSSVVSFASTAATHHDLDTRIDMMQSLISLLGTHDKDDMSRTLLAMSNSRDSCAAMRQSGCLPLLIDLIHGHDNPMARRDCRARAGLALHNIVYSNPEDRRGRREIRVLRLLEIVRAHCDAILYSNLPPHPCAERWYPPLRDYGPGPAVAALMKLSFEEEHRTAICELGGLHAIAELVEIDNKVNADCNDTYSIGLRKYAGMTLTNLTFGNTNNKTILCKMEKTIKALITQLRTTDEEELVQASASVLRNLSWRADDISRDSLRKVGAVKALTEAAQKTNGETALRTLLSGLWNLSAHCPENKTELCNVPGALRFFVKSLNYSSPSGNISVVESSGGILRNLSSHIAVRPECRQILRDNRCFHTLLSHLRSPSQRVVSNACGALWNLSARCIEDQELLWELGAVSLLKSLVNSKHKAIATASSAALRNLMSVKPASSNATDSESVSSRNARRYRSMPRGNRQVEPHTNLRNSARGIHGEVSPGVRSRHSSPRSQTPTVQTPKVQSPRPQSPVVHLNQRAVQVPHNNVNKEPTAKDKHKESESSLENMESNHKNIDKHQSSPPLTRSRSDMGPAIRRRENTGTSGVAMDSSSVGSGASIEGRHGHLGRWSGSNDSLARHRRNRNSSRPHKNVAKQAEAPRTSGGQHSRSSSDGCAVIQLLTDGYPLQVTAKANMAAISGNQGVENSKRQGMTGVNRPTGHLSDTASVVSPGTARRLNQWAEEQAIESIEMSQLYICAAGENGVANPPVAASRESMGSNASRHRRKQSQRFRSFRDSDSEREGDIDSDDERTVFSSKGGFVNAWVSKTGSKTSRPNNGSQAHSSKKLSNKSENTGNKNPQCSCKKVSNIWIKRAKSKSKALCENCSKENRESGRGSEDSRPVIKSRRDSSDSSLSSPNAMRGFMANTDREDMDTDPSKRGVKVTSL